MRPLPLCATVPALDRLTTAACHRAPGASLLVCCHIGRPTGRFACAHRMLLHPSGALVRQCLPRKPRRAIAVLHPLQCALHITCTPSQFVNVIKVSPSYTNSPPLTPTCKPATAAYNLTTTPHHHHLSPDSYTHPSPLTRLNPTHGKPRYPAPECRVRCIPEGINATVPHTRPSASLMVKF
jgi:hypothetical protein